MRAFLDKNEVVRLWRILITTDTAVPDFEDLLPAMLVGGRKYFGTHYENLRFEPINTRSRAVRYISGEREVQ